MTATLSEEAKVCKYCKEKYYEDDEVTKLVGWNKQPLIFDSPNCLMNWFKEQDNEITDDFFPEFLIEVFTNLEKEIEKLPIKMESLGIPIYERALKDVLELLRIKKEESK